MTRAKTDDVAVEEPPRRKMTPEVIGALRAMEGRTNGQLDPREVVREAEDPQSPLHPFFEWDNDAAAEAWRLEQARVLIRRVKFEVQIEDRQVRTVRYVAEPRTDEAMYASLPKVRRPDHVASVMAAELARIVGNVDRALGIARVKAAMLPAGLPESLESLRQGLFDLLEECRG